LLDTWIHKSQKLNYEEIDVNDHCKQLIRLSEDLDAHDQIKLDKLSILLNPLDDEEFISKYLNLDNDDFEHYFFFIKKLIKVGIFDTKSDWFKHEFIKSCFRINIHDNIKKKYHEEVANHYSSLMEKKEKESSSSNLNFNQQYYKLQHGYAYHLHNEGKYIESFNYNKKVAEMATRLGDLDEAELCYKRCLDSALKYKNIDKNSHNDILFALSYIYTTYGEDMKKLYPIIKIY
jgi:hypothetical protein